MGEEHVENWLLHRLAEMAGVHGEAVPLQALMAERLGSLQPQQLFDGMKRLLEQGRVELVQEDAEAPRAVLVTQPVAGAWHGRTRPLGQGELADLAAAIAAARTRRNAGPAQGLVAAFNRIKTDAPRAEFRLRMSR